MLELKAATGTEASADERKRSSVVRAGPEALVVMLSENDPAKPHGLTLASWYDGHAMFSVPDARGTQFRPRARPRLLFCRAALATISLTITGTSSSQAGIPARGNCWLYARTPPEQS
jgi:hypothetical protein